jgi:diguanylate cyclase (GGDEF)-like protein/PAS domain S-box-containing protein
MPNSKRSSESPSFSGERNNERLQALLEHLPVGIYRTTPEGKIIEVNPALVEMLRYSSEEELKNINVKDLYVKTKDRAKHLKQLEDAATDFSEFEIRCKDGSTIWCRDYPRAVKGPQGKITYYDGILVDISRQKKADENLKKALRELARSNKERRKMIKELENLSLQDPLTGIYNRRGFTTIAEEYLKLADRKKMNMFLLFVDVDNLKVINDTYGHNFGDKTLVSLVNIILNTFRKSDIKARVGGDEFAVFPIDTTSEGVSLAVDRFKNNIEAFNSKSSLPTPLSVSMGAAHYNPKHPCSVDELVNRADTLMYKDKKKKTKR